MHSTDNTAIKTDGKCYVGIETNGSLVATRLYPAPPSTLNDYPVENQVYDLRMQVKLFSIKKFLLLPSLHIVCSLNIYR